MPDEAESEQQNLLDIITELEERFPGVTGYVLHENGSLRQHVNIFLDDRIVLDRTTLSDSLEGVSEIYFMQALSGG